MVTLCSSYMSHSKYKFIAKTVNSMDEEKIDLRSVANLRKDKIIFLIDKKNLCQ